MSQEKGDDLHVIDTSKMLTLDELKELKRLASMSRSARFFFAIIIGAVSVVGLDKLIDLITVNHK